MRAGGSRRRTLRDDLWRKRTRALIGTRALEWDAACVRRLNRATAYRPCLSLFHWASRLGDGSLWVVVVLFLPLLEGAAGLRCAVQMTLVAALCAILYKIVKQLTARPRPYAQLGGIQLGARALDEFSFPSGHTLHAVALTLTLAGYFPAIALVLTPFVLLIAASRVILGLHYPSDVLAGALIGSAVAYGGLLLQVSLESAVVFVY